MSQEHGPQNPKGNERAQAELESAAQEKLRELSEQSGERPDPGKADRAERAREVIKQQEVKPEPGSAGEAGNRGSSMGARLNQALNYSQTLASVQRRLRPASRSFSQVIHAPAVERTSEVLEKTVLRPSVALGATWTALIIGMIFYMTARYYGWSLSGFEILGALIVGGILGYVIEVMMLAGKKRRG